MKKTSPLKDHVLMHYHAYPSFTDWSFGFILPDQQEELDELYAYAQAHHGDLRPPNLIPVAEGVEIHVTPLAQQIKAQKRRQIEQIEALFISEDGHCLGDHDSRSGDRLLCQLDDTTK